MRKTPCITGLKFPKYLFLQEILIRVVGSCKILLKIDQLSRSYHLQDLAGFVSRKRYIKVGCGITRDIYLPESHANPTLGADSLK